MGLHPKLLLLWVCLFLSVAVSCFPDNEMSTEEYEMPTEEMMPSYPEEPHAACFFPFRYNKNVFYDCIQFNSKHKWCSVTPTFHGRWKYCSEDDLAKCVFPFWYRRLIYWECTEDSDAFGKKWCSLTQNYNKDKIWKYCDLP